MDESPVVIATTFENLRIYRDGVWRELEYVPPTHVAPEPGKHCSLCGHKRPSSNAERQKRYRERKAARGGRSDGG